MHTILLEGGGEREREREKKKREGEGNYSPIHSAWFIRNANFSTLLVPFLIFLKI